MDASTLTMDDDVADDVGGKMVVGGIVGGIEMGKKAPVALSL